MTTPKKTGTEIELHGDVFAAAAAHLADGSVPFSLPTDALLGGEGPAADMLAATSLDELDNLAAQETQPLEEYEGAKLRVLSLKVLPSSVEGGDLPFYLLASCETLSGDIVLVTIGGRTPMAYLLRRQSLGGIPMEGDRYLVFSRASKATKGGYHPWNVRVVKGDDF
ncbi:MAG TPA: hypothetical protein VMU09_04155 [Acidimicrobiales bacterium]|nr:hypothetical protein [Acidimicrobiales bacterium]